MSDIDVWLEKLERQTKLPSEEIYKKGRCLLGALKLADEEYAIKLLSKWFYQYLKLVCREKGITTVKELYAFLKKYHPVELAKYFPKPSIYVMLKEGTKSNFKKYAERHGLSLNLDNFLKYVASKSASVFLNNMYLYFGEGAIPTDEAWLDFLIMKLYDYMSNLLADEHTYEIINVINSYIEKRRFYGLRTEKVPPKFCILSWSNAWEEWIFDFMTADYVKKHRLKEVRLDANQIIVPYSCKEVAKVICFLKPLPLYAYSFEYKTRYLTPSEFKRHSADWVRRQIMSEIVKILGGNIHE